MAGVGGTESRIRELLVEIRPLLPGEARVELVSFDASSGTVTIRIDGGCADCDMPADVFARAIEANLRSNVERVKSVTVLNN